MSPKIRWHMNWLWSIMVYHLRMPFFIAIFMCFLKKLSDRTWRSGRSLTTSSDFFVKIISCCIHRFVPDLIYHQYGISRMYSEENPKDFRLPVPCLYPWEWVMLLLSTEAAFKPGGPFLGEFTSENLSQGFIPGRPSLAYKGCGYSIFCTELSVGIIGIYGTGSHASYPPSRARGFPHQCCLHLPL